MKIFSMIIGMIMIFRLDEINLDAPKTMQVVYILAAISLIIAPLFVQ